MDIQTLKSQEAQQNSSLKEENKWERGFQRERLIPHHKSGVQSIAAVCMWELVLGPKLKAAASAPHLPHVTGYGPCPPDLTLTPHSTLHTPLSVLIPPTPPPPPQQQQQQDVRPASAPLPICLRILRNFTPSVRPPPSPCVDKLVPQAIKYTCRRITLMWSGSSPAEQILSIFNQYQLTCFQPTFV